MGQMRIAEVDEDYAAADFSFPNNPRTVNAPMSAGRALVPIPLGRMHRANYYLGTDPKVITLSGQFFGSTRRATYNDLAAHNQGGLKKLYTEDGKFYYVVGNQNNELLSGDRANFIDYVSTWWTPIPYRHSDPIKAAGQTFGTGDASSLASGVTFTPETITGDDSLVHQTTINNGGNAPAFLRWQIDFYGNLSGSPILEFTCGDGATEALSNRVNVFTYDPRTDPPNPLGSEHTLNVWAIRETAGAGNQFSVDFSVPHLYDAPGTYGGSGTAPALKTADGVADIDSGSSSGFDTTGIPQIDAGATNQSLFVKFKALNDSFTISDTEPVIIRAVWRDTNFV